MIDVREQILVRIMEILRDMDGAPVEAAYRNRSGLRGTARPCAIMLDGDEDVVGTLEARQSSRGTPSDQPRPKVIGLKPEIYYAMKVKPTAQSEDIGPELSGYRMAVLAAIETDQELADLLGPNGGVYYWGHRTDLKSGMQGLGVQQFLFEFRYVLRPEHLT